MHVIFVALDEEEMTALPDHILHRRWSYNATSTMAMTLKSSTQANHHLRQLVGSAVRTIAKTNLPTSFLVRGHSKRRVEFKKLRRNERTGDRILVQSDVEKHNMVQSMLAPIISDMEQSSSDLFFKKLAMVEVACKGLREAFSRMTVPASSEAIRDNIQLQECSDRDSIEEIAVPSEADESVDAGSHLEFEDEFLELENMINAPYKNVGRMHNNAVQLADANDGAHGENAADKKNTVDHHVLKLRSGKGDEAICDTSDEIDTNGDDNGDEQLNGDGDLNGDANGDGDLNGDANGDGDLVDGDDHPPLAEDARTQSTEAQSKTTRLAPPHEKKKARKDTYRRLTQLTLPPSLQSSRSNSRKRGSTKKLKHPRISVEVTIEEYGNGVPIADVVAWLERSIDHDKIVKVFSAYPVVRNKASDSMCKVIVDPEKTEGSVTSVGVVFGYAAVTNALVNLRTDLRLSKLVFPRPKYAIQLLPDPTPYHEYVS